MASKSSRARSHRRDRRLAKASAWRREGKQSMGGRIGHGNSNTVGHVGKAQKAPLKSMLKTSHARCPIVGEPSIEPTLEIPRLCVTIGDRVAAKAKR